MPYGRSALSRGGRARGGGESGEPREPREFRESREPRESEYRESIESREGLIINTSVKKLVHALRLEQNIPKIINSSQNKAFNLVLNCTNRD